jgi:hypothetical protein
MRVRLVRKLADLLDGIDVSAYRCGDVIDLSRRDAELLIAERWAVPAPVPVLRTLERQYQRRAEDRIREEIHNDSEMTPPATGDSPPIGGDTPSGTEPQDARNAGGEGDPSFRGRGDGHSDS